MQQNDTNISIYANYGRFNIYFEQMCFFMRGYIKFSFSLKGCNVQPYIDILLNDENATKLAAKSRSFLLIDFEGEKNKEIIAKLYKGVSELIETRNYLIHGTTLINDVFVRNGAPMFFKGKIGSKGNWQEEVIFNNERLTELAKEAAFYGNCFSQLTMIKVQEDNLSSKITLGMIKDKSGVEGFMKTNLDIL